MDRCKIKTGGKLSTPIDPITAAFGLGQSVIERIWPDANKRAEELRKLEELRQKGDLAELQAHVQLLLAQIEVNKIEAASDSLFKSGWRPGIGWVCAATLALSYMPKAVVLTAMWSLQCYAMYKAGTLITVSALPVFPDLGVTDIIGLLGSILGIAGMRSFDKSKGVN